MATFYVDPTAAAPGNGTLASPFASWTSVAWAPGNTYLQKRGTTHTGVFRLSAGGTQAAPITVGAWFNPDGSDDPAQPRPVIVLPAAPVTPQDGAAVAVPGQERDFVTYRHLDIRNGALPQASDVALVWLGNHCVIESSRISSNCGGIYMYEKTGVSVSNCLLDVVDCRPEHTNHGILVAGKSRIGDISLVGNTIVHHGGGSPRSFGIRCEASEPGSAITDLVIAGNRIAPPADQAYSRNRDAIGIYVVNGIAARIDGNAVSGMLSGIFLSGGERNYVGNNNCSTNLNFGIHVTGFAKGYLIEGNICNYNGSDLHPNGYGRGIELSSSAGPDAVSGHTIRFNTCSFNYNFGGKIDNGSEGVGIGLDDGTARCLVYGNLTSHNEGNGIQVYGGDQADKFPDTGGHLIMSNVLYTNCRLSVNNRRHGGSDPSPFSAHIQLAFTHGTPTIISSNILAGSTRDGVAQGTTSSNVLSVNNVYLGVPVPAQNDTVILGPPAPQLS